MLLEFTIKNYKSFREQTTLSMIASNDNEKEKSNVFPITYENSAKKQQNRLLKSAIIYGANASGKSNFFDAYSFMKGFVVNSSKNTQADEPIHVAPFTFNVNSDNKPSLFEIVYFFNNTRYRYGFEVDKKKIHSEWLFYAPKGKESKLFIRNKNGIELADSFKKEGKVFVDKTRANALFLSVCAQFDGEISKEVLRSFSMINIISGIDDKGYDKTTIEKLKNEQFRKKVLQILQHADLGINDIHHEKKEFDGKNINSDIRGKIVLHKDLSEKKDLKTDDSIFSVLSGLYYYELTTLHNVYNNKKEATGIRSLQFFNESEGTQKFFSIIVQILDTLQNGEVLFIDEFEARLHPKLTSFIVNLFNSKKINKKNAQLIITSHDTTLLTNKFFRRDQIWFCEKSKYGESELFSLMDFKDDANEKVRKDASYNKNYLLGKYGAIPILGDPKEIFENINE